MNHLLTDSALTQHIAVLGKTGSGKTSTAKLIVEHVVAQGARVCILDPIKSDWWGLTSSTDGKHAGLPFQILGGPHGHVALHDNAGHAIGELVATGALPLSIIDMADFKAGGANRFFNAFAETLMRKMRGVLYLVVEEAHEFAPKERSGVGDENMAIYYAKKLATAGRTKGIRLIVCSQRVQSLHNAVLGSCETLIVHKFTAPADQAPVLTWLKSNVGDKDERTRIEQSLRTLKIGQGWVCSGEQKLDLKQFPRITTFDNSKTPDSNDASAKVVTAQVDVEALRAAVGEAVLEAEANDPAKLRHRIRELERQLHRPEEMAVDIEAIKRKAFEQGKNSAYQNARSLAVSAILKTLSNVSECITQQSGIAESVVAHHLPIEESTDELPKTLAGLKSVADKMSAQRSAAAKFSHNNGITKAKQGHNNVSEGLKPVEQRVLDALAEAEQLSASNPDRSLLALLSGYTHIQSTGFVKALGALRTAGHIDYPSGGTVCLTDSGREVANMPDRPTTPEELQQRVCDLIGGAATKVLQPLIDAYPKALTRQALAEAAGYGHIQSTGFVKVLGRLNTLGFTEAPRGTGTVVARPVLFLEGR